MNEQERSDLSIALTLVAARANRMAAFIYSYVAFPELGKSPTAAARGAAVETADMFETLLTGRTVGTTAETKMLPARGRWLDDFMQSDRENRSLTWTDAAIRLREMEYANQPHEIYRELGAMLLDLAKAATNELMKVADPTVVRLHKGSEGARPK